MNHLAARGSVIVLGAVSVDMERQQIGHNVTFALEVSFLLSSYLSYFDVSQYLIQYNLQFL